MGGVSLFVVTFIMRCDDGQIMIRYDYVRRWHYAGCTGKY